MDTKIHDGSAEKESEMAGLSMPQPRTLTFWLPVSSGGLAVGDFDNAGALDFLLTRTEKMPESKMKELLGENPFVKKMPKTITPRAYLVSHLASVRKQGVAYDMEENLSGVTCVACSDIRSCWACSRRVQHIVLTGRS
jgi:hypothetical protein